jgi:hypothetical protein
LSLFLIVHTKRKNNISKFCARLLIVSSLICVLFGNGVHVHSLIDHIFEHGDIHVYIHAHDNRSSTSDENQHTSDEENDNHQIAKVDLNGVSTQSRYLASNIDVSEIVVAVLTVRDFQLDKDHISELDRPPPEVSYFGFSPSSFSLRAPPLA